MMTAKTLFYFTFNFHQIIVIKIQKVLYKYRIAVFIQVNTVT